MNPLFRRLYGFLNRRSIERELDDEMAFHRDMLARDLEHQGLDSDRAQEQATRRLGNSLALRERSADARGLPFLQDIGRDLTYTVRALRRSRGFTTMAIVSLALGIAATTTMFSIIDAVDLRPLPFANGDRLVVLYERAPAGHRVCSGRLGCMMGMSVPAIADWQRQSRTLMSIGLYEPHRFRLHRGMEAERLATAAVTPELFTVLGSPALFGRTLQKGDEQVIVLGHRLWQSRFAGDSSIVGQRLNLIDENRRTESVVTVIGVMPAGFSVLSSEAWVPFSPGSSFFGVMRDNRLGFAVGLLAPGRTVADADREATLIATRLAAEYPSTNRGWTAGAMPFNGTTELQYNQSGDAGFNAGAGRFTLFGVVGFVLFIAVLNVASLCVVRTVGRRRELTIRSALGASTGRLTRLVILECLVIAAAGGLIGVLLSVWGTRWVGSALYLDAAALPIGVSVRVLAFTLITSTLAGVMAGILPTFAATRFDASGALETRLGARDTSRSSVAQAWLVAAEVACGLILLTGAGRLAKELAHYRYSEPGYEAHQLYRIDPNFGVTVKHDSGQQAAIAASLLERVRRESGVLAASLAISRGVRVAPDGTSPTTGWMEELDVGDDFFRIVGVRISKGRGFDGNDLAGGVRVVIVDSSVAARLWPALDPIGQVLVYPDSIRGPERVTVVGVAAPTKLGRSLIGPPRSSVYRPMAQVAPGRIRFTGEVYARVDGAPQRVLSSLRTALHDVTGAPVNQTDVISLEAQLNVELRQQRFHTTAVSAFALFGLFLAALGLYGVTSYAAGVRRREMAIRMALGAERRAVLGLVARRGLWIAAVGTAVGLAGALAMQRVLASLLIQPGASDLRVWVASALVLVVCVLVASILPARAAANDDLMTTLRSD